MSAVPSCTRSTLFGVVSSVPARGVGAPPSAGSVKMSPRSCLLVGSVAPGSAMKRVLPSVLMVMPKGAANGAPTFTATGVVALPSAGALNTPVSDVVGSTAVKKMVVPAGSGVASSALAASAAVVTLPPNIPPVPAPVLEAGGGPRLGLVVVEVLVLVELDVPPPPPVLPSPPLQPSFAPAATSKPANAASGPARCQNDLCLASVMRPPFLE